VLQLLLRAIQKKNILYLIFLLFFRSYGLVKEKLNKLCDKIVPKLLYHNSLLLKQRQIQQSICELNETF
jgi:hypothetical protein